ncbi:uncharacterized protein LOC123314036 [Coccinella septempunctata]|uniref:uncharacterized protein LOC123314036 n=1 Tax=Coccinella septempunctata TaxID=41139 RepID=UPI001D090C30|nr:uncharacterized protein LOC123314036 [Coccinella septempunctata]
MLITTDFDRIHPDREVKLFSKWQTFYDDLYKLCERNIKDFSFADIQENAKADNEEVRFIHQLMSIPFLIPPKGRLIQNKSHWKFSIQEVVQGLIVHAKSSGDIGQIVEDQRNKASKESKLFNPIC